MFIFTLSLSFTVVKNLALSLNKRTRGALPIALILFNLREIW